MITCNVGMRYVFKYIYIYIYASTHLVSQTMFPRDLPRPPDLRHGPGVQLRMRVLRCAGRGLRDLGQGAERLCRRGRTRFESSGERAVAPLFCWGVKTHSLQKGIFLAWGLFCFSLFSGE